MKAIWEAGPRIPEYIAIVGVGNFALGDMLRVPLTTVSWSRKDRGLNAAELLPDGLVGDEPDPPRRVIIPPQLVVRESCGASGSSVVNSRASRAHRLSFRAVGGTVWYINYDF